MAAFEKLIMSSFARKQILFALSAFFDCFWLLQIGKWYDDENWGKHALFDCPQPCMAYPVYLLARKARCAIRDWQEKEYIDGKSRTVIKLVPFPAMISWLAARLGSATGSLVVANKGEKIGKWSLEIELIELFLWHLTWRTRSLAHDFCGSYTGKRTRT